MPKYVIIGYGDQTSYERIAPTLRDAIHAHDDELKRRCSDRHHPALP